MRVCQKPVTRPLELRHALHGPTKSYPRQWVVVSDPTYKRADPAPLFLNVPTPKEPAKLDKPNITPLVVCLPRSDLFYANVKIEQSAPESYLQDKETLVNQLKYYSSTKQATAIAFADKTTINGFEHYGVDRDKIDVGGQVGIHLLFYDPAHLVLTIYFLNQSKAVFFNKRRFESITEYREVRDDFLNHYSICLKRIADGQH